MKTVSEVCVLCGRTMRMGQTKPYWIVDPESLEVLGKSHKGCRDRFNYRELKYRLSLPVKGDPPSMEHRVFAKRMILLYFAQPPWEKQTELCRLLTLGQFMYEATNVEELLERSSKLMNWWSREGGTITMSELEDLKTWLRDNLR